MPHPAPHIFISTGEVSGDLQGSLLIAAIQRQADQYNCPVTISALGGDRMAATGATLLGNTQGIGSVGLLESLQFVWPTLRLQQQVRTYLQAHPPDLVVLIDYAGVNLPMGAYIRRHFSVPILYYIAPQAWAVANSTQVTQQVIDLVDEVIAIFPQEAAHFAAQGAQVTWVGHPLVDHLQHAPDRVSARASLGIPDDQLAIALVPASRQQELIHVLPVICAAAQQIHAQLPQAHFWIPVSRAPYRVAIAQAIQAHGLPATLTSEPQITLAAADLAIVKSGTVNLEAALMGVPQVVLYRLSPLSYWVFRHLLQYQVSFISPVNLVSEQPVVPELLQAQATPQTIAATALELLQPQIRQQMLRGYAHLRQQLGPVGSLDRAAARIFAYLVSAPAKD